MNSDCAIVSKQISITKGPTMKNLEGKTAIITGASRGIGAATALQFAKHGAKVVLAARSGAAIDSIAAQITQAGGKAIAIQCDVSSFQDVSETISQCVTSLGALDILVNNAGLIDPISRLADSDPVEWAHVVDVNYKGVYYGMRAALPHMLKQKSGAIINISSGAATSALEGWSHYCSTKAAVLSLTMCADKEYRQQGIYVAGLSPGTVATEMQTIIRASGINPVSQLDPCIHIPADWPARAIAWLCAARPAQFAGTDFSLKDDENRKLVGLIK
jgi:NAD(P)-dependent dehydrogenase (short-subunit alcohol dehydrogenase family)